MCTRPDSSSCIALFVIALSFLRGALDSGTQVMSYLICLRRFDAVRARRYTFALLAAWVSVQPHEIVAYEFYFLEAVI